MKLFINGTEINVMDAHTYEHPNGRRELDVTVPKDEITFAELEELFERSETTSSNIVVTRDDGSTEAFIGYGTRNPQITSKYVKDRDGNEVKVYVVTTYCVSEMERKALEAEYKAKEAEKQAQTLAELVEQQKQALAALNEQLLVTQLAVVEMHEASKAAPEVTEPAEPEVVEPEVIEESEEE